MSEVALRQPGAILGREGVRGVRRIYAYDNSQTIKIRTAIENHTQDSLSGIDLQGWHAEIPLTLGASTTAVVGRPGGYETAVLTGSQDAHCHIRRVTMNHFDGLLGGQVSGSFAPKNTKPRDIGWASLSDGEERAISNSRLSVNRTK